MTFAVCSEGVLGVGWADCYGGGAGEYGELRPGEGFWHLKLFHSTRVCVGCQDLRVAADSAARSFRGHARTAVTARPCTMGHQGQESLGTPALVVDTKIRVIGCSALIHPTCDICYPSGPKSSSVKKNMMSKPHKLSMLPNCLMRQRSTQASVSFCGFARDL